MSNISNRVKKLEKRATSDNSFFVVPMYMGETKEQALALATGGKTVPEECLVIFATQYIKRPKGK